MTQDQLRQALGELNGDRDVEFRFVGQSEPLSVTNALLVPEEPDGVVKLTDGKKVFFLDADRVAWVEIG